MQKKLKKTYKFAFKTALFITLFLTLLMSVFLYQFYTFDWIQITFIALTCYVFSFVIIQYRVEQFIYKRVKKIYDDLTLLESSNLRKNRITTDMATLTEEIDKFAKDRKLEIETLKVREEYRKEFLGNISHELKTPLFTVQGYILTLLEGAINDKSIRSKYLERANKGVERLIDVVKDLDMISKLESGGMNLVMENFNIVELIQNVFDLLEMKAKKRNIILAFNKPYVTPLLVNADLNRIEQVLINLIENSIKYGKAHGKSIVSIQNYDNDSFIIKVSDDGEGVNEANKSRLFERFFRVDQSRSREQGGSGLGLSIVKHITEAHQQQVFVDSEYGVGSTFSFTLKKVK